MTDSSEPDAPASEAPMANGRRHERERDAERPEADVGHAHRTDGEPGPAVAHRDRSLVGLEEVVDEVDDEDLQPERQKERCQDGRAHDLVDEQALDRVADREQHDHRDGDRQERIDAGQLVQVERQVRAQHDEGAVGEIDDVHDPPDEGEAERDQREDPAEQDRVDDDLAQLGRAHRADPGMGYRASFSATEGGNTVYFLPSGWSCSTAIGLDTLTPRPSNLIGP